MKTKFKVSIGQNVGLVPGTTGYIFKVTVDGVVSYRTKCGRDRKALRAEVISEVEQRLKNS